MLHTQDPSFDTRALEILERIRGVFASKGFDGASMQDLARAAEMSAGNFYRYFPSKDAIIEAMIARDLAEVEADFSAILNADNPRTALLETADRHIRQKAQHDAPLWAEIEAASIRRREVADLASQMEEVLLSNIARVFARLTGLSEAEASERFRAHAQLLVVLVKGAAIDSCVPQGAGEAGPSRRGEDFHALVLRTVDHILDDVIALSRT